jgi:molecular chaperone DnaJ
MAKRDFYAILGVPFDASSQAIKDAYRRRAIQMHPDSSRLDPARFREVRDAYEVLSDAARRRSYDVEIGRIARRSAPIEEISAGAIRIIDDFQTMTPSLGEVLDHIAQNFFGFHQKSGGPRRRLEIVLNRDEASTGGRLPFEVPCYEPCPRCEGRAWMWGLCPACHGFGLVETERQVTLELPAGIRSGSRHEVALDNVGIGNLVLDVTILVA